MFLFRASAILAELERLSPELVSSCRAALDHDSADLEFLRLEREAFARCANVAIDVAVMERTLLGLWLPLEAGWSDVGSWKSALGNRRSGFRRQRLAGAGDQARAAATVTCAASIAWWWASASMIWW